MHNLYTISNFLRFIPKLAVILTCSRFDYDITPDDKRVLYTYNNILSYLETACVMKSAKDLT